MNELLRNFTILVFGTALFLSCSNEDNVAPVAENPQDRVLISADTFLIRTAGDLITFLESGGLASSADELKYGAVIYKVVYRTKYKGAEINASGLVILPVTDEEVDMLSFQHGTITADADAPSNLGLQSSELILYSAIASTGLVAVAPDFIGFGASSDIPHPYYVEDLTASAVIDNIKAARELAAEMGISFSGNLFLAGYSQGGHATMATHKAIENEAINGIDLVASFPSSGGYDVKGFQEYFFTLDTYHQPAFLGYVVNAYKTAYDLDLAYSDVFNEPYAGRISDLFNGTYTLTEVSAQLNDTLSVLMTKDVLDGLETDEKFMAFRDLLVSNSLTNWVPQNPMFMYHGDADTTVPYQNSVDTYDQLMQNGASPDIVTFTPLPGATHATGIVPYIELLVDEVTRLRN